MGVLGEVGMATSRLEAELRRIGGSLKPLHAAGLPSLLGSTTCALM
jgi:hypothetical protein